MAYPGSTAEATPSQSMMNQFYHQAQAQGNMMGASVQPMRQPAPVKNTPLDGNLPVEELVKRMTYEQAKAVVIGGKGKFGGKSKGEVARSEEHTSELQSRFDLVCRLLLEKKKI